MKHDILRTKLRVDIKHHIKRLTMRHHLPHMTVIKSLFMIQDLLIPELYNECVLKLLSLLPLSLEGLNPVGVCLLHPRWEVRMAAARIIQLIGQHEVPQFYFF